MPERDRIVLNRDCGARRVPDGGEVMLRAGTEVWITQELGGSFTVEAGGSLLRIEGADADALGREAQQEADVGSDASDAEVERVVWDRLRTCYDPEIPINIVDLGLVYAMEITGAAPALTVRVEMTLTAPGCGMGPVLVEDVRGKLESLAAVAHADVELTFDPPWSPERMSEAARLQTGML